MRTTLDLDEDLILAAKELAVRNSRTMGQIISQLVRKALEPDESPLIRNGIPLFKPQPGSAKPSLELINLLRDE
jgi:hypothetical protein